MLNRAEIYDTELYTSESDFPLPIELVDSDVDLYYRIAFSMYLEVEANNAAGRDSVFIVPVGPVFQYRRFVWLLRERPIDLSRLHLFFMDEYLDGDGSLIAPESPLSFRGFIQRELIDPMSALASSGASAAGFSSEQVHFPDPAAPGDFDRKLSDLGGAHVCYAGVGINGHLAFNEPEGALPADGFQQLGTRVVPLSRETITINSNTALRGAFDMVPSQAITVGFRQIMEARRLRIYLNRPWQGAVVRKLLFGEISPSFPASFARRHRDAALTVTPEVAQRPAFALK